MQNMLTLANGRILRWTALSVVPGMLLAACGAGQAMLIATVLARSLEGRTVAELVPFLACYLALLLLKFFLLWGGERAAQACARIVKTDLRQRLLAHLVLLGPAVLSTRRTGDLQSNVVAGVEALETYYSRYLPAVGIAAIACTGLVLAVAALDMPSAAILAAFLLAFPLVDEAWMRWRMPKGSGVFQAMGDFASTLLDSLRGIVALKAFSAVTARRSLLATKAAALRHEAMLTLRVSLMRTGLTGLVMLSGVATLICVNAARAAVGDLSPFVLFATFFLAPEAFRPLGRVEKEFHTAWAAGGAGAQIRSLLALTPPVTSPSRLAPMPARFDIALDHVGFAYPASDRNSLSDLSFQLREREFVALVGPSGAGKSTVAALLQRFFDPSAGEIRIGGTDIRNLELGALRSRISVVSQEAFLFAGTIADNLRLAKADATDTDLREAARAAHISDFIESLPQGYDTPVGEQGAGLSGGQRQRLAIARALLKDAPILMLDEATSNVDVQSEKAIQAALQTVAGTRSLLVITHRLSTVASADRVIVLAEGRLVEAGSPAEIGAAGGAFGKLLAADLVGEVS